MEASVTQTQSALDKICPLHVVLDASGIITHLGPTLRKICPDITCGSVFFEEVFELRRPKAQASVDVLLNAAGSKLHLSLRKSPHTNFKCIAVALGNGVLVDLSFGIDAVNAIGEFNLTSADFAPTDLTVEMLYLIEAKSAVMEELRKLNLRLQGAKIAAEEQAYTDTLTGLKNRRAMELLLTRFIEDNTAFALLYLDLDHFKNVNDTLGHGAGDVVLQHTAKVLVSKTSNADAVARVGGDEFVILIRGQKKIEEIERISFRIIAELEKPIRVKGQLCTTSCSIGATLAGTDQKPDVDQMMADADKALYEAKAAGRGRVRVFEKKFQPIKRSSNMQDSICSNK